MYQFNKKTKNKKEYISQLMVKQPSFRKQIIIAGNNLIKLGEQGAAQNLIQRYMKLLEKYMDLSQTK